MRGQEGKEEWGKSVLREPTSAQGALWERSGGWGSLSALPSLFPSLEGHAPYA